ncbi:hypothetical protein BGZ63DRAFT_414491 [Mariannaea sp. PMI_226]|nr:hypothetical protein BGZ63DRAFT_414491 [Mariannaea sp. PMI_226]
MLEGKRQDIHPCKVLSDAYIAANGSLGRTALLNVKPSVGIACLKSVPLNKERDLALLKYMKPYVEFQSTLEVLANPPEDYLFEGVDVLGGLEAMENKLSDDQYKSQYEFMFDLRSIFAASNDNHFDYPPILLTMMQFVRIGFSLYSLSQDGVHIPEIFMAIDIYTANNRSLDYQPSSISCVDGIPINKWLENNAIYQPANFQDPDAQFNHLFMSIQWSANRFSGASLFSFWEMPDNHTVQFRNGSQRVIENHVLIGPNTDFSKIESGEDIQNLYEIPPPPPSGTPSPSGAPSPSGTPSGTHSSTGPVTSSASASPTSATESGNKPKPPTGFPEPLVQHSLGSLAGYFLDGDEYKDTAVLSIRSFMPIGSSPSTLANFNVTNFILESRAVLTSLFTQAQKEGRDKLVIDVSANGGGLVNLAFDIYRLLFPTGEFSAFNRLRANDALRVLSGTNFTTLNNWWVTRSSSWPVDSKGIAITSGEKWFGPYLAGNQEVSAAYLQDFHKPIDTHPLTYINGENETYTAIHDAIFKPENIIIVTDGTCASACTILTGLLTRNHNVRTVALGGRPHYQAMQAVGGVKGARANSNADLFKAIYGMRTSLKDNEAASDALEAASASNILPSLANAPLLPLFQSAAAGGFNALSAYAGDDLDGYPLQFQYQAANCRLFYTQAMTREVTEQWRAAASVAWKNGKCVRGSTTNDDNTMGSDTVKYDSRVRSQAVPMSNPGARSRNDKYGRPF